MDQAGDVIVWCGVDSSIVKAGQTIAQIRRTLKVDDDEALVDAENQGEDMIVKKGQILEFIKPLKYWK